MAAQRSDVVRRLARSAVGLLVVLLAMAAGVLMAPRLSTPGDASVEAEFARDMATHHGQAVDMSFIARDASTDAELRTIASDIIVTQSTQRGVFMGWLQQWAVPQASSRPRMAWMPGHVHLVSDAPVLMHGMASDAEMQQLRNARGLDVVILFLQMMIRHHEGGIIMARAVVELSSRREVIAIARSIEDSQRVEITHMKAMLAARDAMPLPSLLP